MNAPDGQTFGNISATTAGFPLVGGKYAVVAMATWGGGNIQLQALALDSATYVNVGSAISANGLSVVELPAGTYRFAVTTATGVYVSISGIPV